MTVTLLEYFYFFIIVVFICSVNQVAHSYDLCISPGVQLLICYSVDEQVISKHAVVSGVAEDSFVSSLRFRCGFGFRFHVSYGLIWV